MATTKSASATRNSNLNATIQWVALVVVAGLAVLAAFVFFGEGSVGGGGGHGGGAPTGGHNGLAPLSVTTS
jgi:hypothetical protein